jgi:nitrilase
MKVAAIQMVSAADLQTNLQAAAGLIEQAAAQGAELAVLPEYFCHLGRKDTDKLAIQEAFGLGPIQEFLQATAQRFGVWLAGGTLPLSAGDTGRVRNSCLVYSPSGDCVARYDKIHLFAYDNGKERYDEARVLQAGDTPVAFDLPSRDGHVWRVGLSICYDLRFAELYRQLQAELLLVPSAFTFTTGQAHWELLLRARAVENLAYVLASAQGGLHENARRTWGHSMAIDPWGEVLAQRDEGAGVVLADLDVTRLKQVRGQLPALDHRVL